jgi:hypothetical protein
MAVRVLLYGAAAAAAAAASPACSAASAYPICYTSAACKARHTCKRSCALVTSIWDKSSRACCCMQTSITQHLPANGALTQQQRDAVR